MTFERLQARASSDVGECSPEKSPLPRGGDSFLTARILHILPHQGGGGETYIDMLERLSGFEHERFYLSAGRTPASALTSIPGRWSRLVSRADTADLLHTHGDVVSTIVRPLLRGRSAVMTTHGLNLLRRVSGVQRLLMIKAMRSVVAACRAVICTSATERDELAPLLRESHYQKLRVIRNGIDPPPLVDEGHRSAIRDELRLEPGAVLGLSTGRLEPNKTPLLGARAAIRIRAAGLPFILAFAGDGPDLQSLQSLAGDAVRVLGYRSDVPRLLAAADLLVHTSEREGMSYALLEAMAQGLAIVAADGLGTPEVVGDAGLLFSVGDEDALVRALRTLASDIPLRTSLGAKARARALGLFSATRFLEATEAVYLDALGRASSSP